MTNENKNAVTELRCCGNWILYPVRGQKSVCPGCETVFTLTDDDTRADLLASLGMRPEDISPALAAADAQAAHEDATSLWWR